MSDESNGGTVSNSSEAISNVVTPVSPVVSNPPVDTPPVSPAVITPPVPDDTTVKLLDFEKRLAYVEANINQAVGIADTVAGTNAKVNNAVNRILNIEETVNKTVETISSHHTEIQSIRDMFSSFSDSLHRLFHGR